MIDNNLTLDDYSIIRTLGAGYSGVVKLGLHSNSQQYFALKIINKNLNNYAKVLEDLEKEAKIMHSLDHKYITKLIDFKTDGVMSSGNEVIEKDVAYAVLEVAENGEIFDVIFKTGALKENTVRYYLAQLIDVMSYLH